MNPEFFVKFTQWRNAAVLDPEMQNELEGMLGHEQQIEEAFYKDLSFGTGGLRGIIGAGTNRINVYTIARATQGLSNYILKRFLPSERKVAVCFDSRNKSTLFAKTAASVLSANGIRAYISSELKPTPYLSYAVRALQCCAGIMITASHNPAEYNGYKVYGSDGCQITNELANEILREMNRLDYFSDIRIANYDEQFKKGEIRFIDKTVYAAYLDEVRKQSLLNNEESADRNISIVYTPLNGTGLIPVTEILSACGFQNVYIVEEQKDPDGNFPTCPVPNPENAQAMSLGLEYACKNDADILLATDPDSDRLGVAIKSGKGQYTLLRRDLSRGGSPKFIKSCNPGTFLNLDSTVLGTYWMKAQPPFVSVGSCAYAIIT